MFAGKIKNLITILCAWMILMPLSSVYASENDDAFEKGTVRPSGAIYADFLKKLGVFYGTDKGFEVEKKLNRDEAAVVIVRLMGAESEALAGTYDMPFHDVDSWARPYVGWMYENNLTSGISKTKFGSKNAVTAQQYLTFLVRCLGYADAKGDFTYEGVFDFAVEKGLFSEAFEANHYRHYRPDFLRFDCTELTFYALTWKMKGSEKALADTLMENGVFTEDTFVDGLRIFARTYGVNEDGKIVKMVRRLGNKVELPWFGTSEETYTSTGWELDDYVIAFTGSGQAGSYAVDSKTLERKSKLSEYEIALVDLNLHNGLLYFYEYQGSVLEGSVAIKTYDWKKDEVKQLLKCDAPVAYGNDGAGDRNILIAGKTDGKYEYNVIDLSTGTVKNCLSEEAESMSAENFNYVLEDGKNRSDLLIKLTFSDEVRYYVYDADILSGDISMPKKSNSDHKAQIKIFANQKGGKSINLVFDNKAIIKINDAKKMTRFADFEQGVVSAFEAQNENVYVLTGKEWYGEELGVVSADGKYTVLLPESIIEGLGVIKITDVSSNGDVTFASEVDQGMMHMDVTTYVYETSSKKAKVVSFVPGRGEFYTPESIKKLLEEVQKKLDGLQK